MNILLLFKKPLLISKLWITVSLFASLIYSQGTMSPPKLTFSLSPTSFEGADTLTLTVSVELEKDWHINSTAPESEYLIPTELKLSGTELGFGPTKFPDPHKKFIKVMGGEISLFEGTFNVTIPVWKLSEKAKLESIQAIFSYQACNDKLCLRPSSVTAYLDSNSSANPSSDNFSKKKVSPSASPDNWKKLIEKFEIAGTTGGFIKPDPFIDFLKNPGGSIERQNAFSGKSIWAIILIILVGGFALNLTPCVFPMIPITIAVIGAGAQASSRTRGFIIGGVYGLGMAITYGILGLVVTLTGSQFGVINSSPAFNFVIAVVFIILALAMFDVIHIDFTKYGSNIQYNKSQRGKIIAVFFMGCLAAILAGACVAPVVISVILYAASLYDQGQTLGLMLPFLLGAGMALPWPLAGAGLSFLPKPGKWMVWVRNIFGVVIMIIALYYGYLGINGIKTSSETPEDIPVDVSDRSELTWNSSLTEGLSKGLSQNRPVFIDFWATWCKNCLVMDATTFKDSTVVSELKKFVLVKYQAENPDEQPSKDLLKRFGIIGLPAYVILEPKSAQ